MFNLPVTTGGINRNQIRNCLVLLLIFIAAGAVLFCTLDSMVPMDSLLSTYADFMAHVVDLGNLTSTIINTAPFTLFSILFLTAFFTFFFALSRSNLFKQEEAKKHFEYKRKGGSYAPQSKIRKWLSLFEISPNLFASV